MSLFTIFANGTRVKRIDVERTPQYPYYHPNSLAVPAMIDYPTEAPKLPSPSIIPVTLDVAPLPPFYAWEFPKSAETVIHNIWWVPPNKMPIMKR